MRHANATQMAKRAPDADFDARHGEFPSISRFAKEGASWIDFPNSSLCAPMIGNNLYIGARPKILGVIRITDHVVIEANADVLVDERNGRDAAGVMAVVRVGGAALEDSNAAIGL